MTPYVALRTLHKLADDDEVTFSTGADLLSASMYVDDALAGTHSMSEALVTRRQLIGVLKTVGVKLRKRGFE